MDGDKPYIANGIFHVAMDEWSRNVSLSFNP